MDQILQGKQFNRGVRAHTLAYDFHAFFQWCLNEDGVANVDERFWQELADTHATFYNHNNAVDLSKLSILFREQLSPLFTVSVSSAVRLLQLLDFGKCFYEQLNLFL